MNTLQSTHYAQLEKISQSFSDLFALGNTAFDNNSNLLSSFPRPVDTQSSKLSSIRFNNKQQPPVYFLNRNLTKITDVQKEYIVGLAGGPSVRGLKDQFGTVWRKDRKESRFFSRRKEIYHLIETKASEEQISCEEARAEQRASIDKFRKPMK